MGKQARQEYLAAIRKRYHLAGKKEKRAILDEFCKEKSCQLHSLASVSQKRQCSRRGKELDHRSSIHRLPTS